jgi:hypothetical protein
MTAQSAASIRFMIRNTVAACTHRLWGRLLSRFQFAGDGAGRHALGDTFLSELDFLNNYRTGAAAPGLKLLFARTDGR